jgi:hypothetical protein
LADAAGPQPVFQGCGDHGPPPRSRGAEASGRAAEAGLGRPGDPGRASPVDACGIAHPAARHARHRTGLAPQANPTQVDVSQLARPTQDQPGNTRACAATGAGEPSLGIPQSARRAVPARLPGQRCDHPADPARPTAQTGPAERGHIMAGFPAHSGARAAGLRLLPRGHDLPETTVRTVRHGVATRHCKSSA